MLHILNMLNMIIYFSFIIIKMYIQYLTILKYKCIYQRQRAFLVFLFILFIPFHQFIVIYMAGEVLFT